MLEIFDNLKPFLEDNYRRFNVREYARIRGISAPTASVLLSRLNKEGLLNREEERNYIYYFANKERVDNPFSYFIWIFFKGRSEGRI